MLNDLNNIHYCSRNRNCNNVEKIIHLNASKESNDIPFANINLLLNNLRNIETLLVLKIDVLNKILNTIPSQIRTLLCLDNFNMYLDKALANNPQYLEQYQLIKNCDYKELSIKLNTMVVYETKHSNQPTQLAFNF